MEDDMILPPSNETNRNAWQGSTWPDNTVYYHFGSSVISGDRNKITAAVAILASRLGQCVKFVQRSSRDRMMVYAVPELVMLEVFRT